MAMKQLFAVFSRLSSWSRLLHLSSWSVAIGSMAILASDGGASASTNAGIAATYGTMTDSRDGKIYRTVTIGDQTWMAENLNYADSVTTTSLKGNSWCYNDVAANCDVAGRLYTWAAAMDSAGEWSTNGEGCGYGEECSPIYPVRGICPSGWHLPSKTEWKTLFGESSAGFKLKSQTGWYDKYGYSRNGTDAFGFSALPAGYRNYDGNFSYDGNLAHFWSSTEDFSNYACDVSLIYSSDGGDLDYRDKSIGFSVRCLRD